MCYFETYKRYKFYIPLMVLGTLMVVIGSLMIAVGTANDWQELWGWGIVMNIFGISGFIFGLIIVCVVYHPTYIEGIPEDPMHKAQMFRAMAYPPFMNMPSQAPNLDQPNALAMHEQMNRDEMMMQQQHYQMATQPPFHKDYLEGQGSYNSSNVYPAVHVAGAGKLQPGSQFSVPGQPYIGGGAYPPSQYGASVPGMSGSQHQLGMSIGGSQYNQPTEPAPAPRTAYAAQGGNMGGGGYMI